MGKSLRKVVALLIAMAVFLTSGLAVFAETSSSSEGGVTPSETTAAPAQVKDVSSHARFKTKTLDVIFTAVPGADSYNIYLNGRLAASGVKGTVTTLAGMTANAMYDITVEAVNSKGAGARSVVVSKTLSKRWFKSTKIKKVKKGKKKVTLRWKKVKGATGYQIEYSKDGKTWNTMFIKGGKKTSATIKKLSKGKWYFKVRPVKGDYLGILSKQKSKKVK